MVARKFNFFNLQFKGRCSLIVLQSVIGAECMSLMQISLLSVKRSNNFYRNFLLCSRKAAD